MQFKSYQTDFDRAKDEHLRSREAMARVLEAGGRSEEAAHFRTAIAHLTNEFYAKSSLLYTSDDKLGAARTMLKDDGLLRLLDDDFASIEALASAAQPLQQLVLGQRFLEHVHERSRRRPVHAVGETRTFQGTLRYSSGAGFRSCYLRLRLTTHVQHRRPVETPMETGMRKPTGRDRVPSTKRLKLTNASVWNGMPTRLRQQAREREITRIATAHARSVGRKYRRSY